MVRGGDETSMHCEYTLCGVRCGPPQGVLYCRASSKSNRAAGFAPGRDVHALNIAEARLRGTRMLRFSRLEKAEARSRFQLPILGGLSRYRTAVPHERQKRSRCTVTYRLPSKKDWS